MRKAWQASRAGSSMTVRFAFAGLRHPHIFDMLRRCHACDEIEVVACCEEDAATREALPTGLEVEVTHDDFASMLDQVECDVVAIGDVYARRGGLMIQALAADKHVIGDKPLCTSLAELEQVEDLAAQKGRVVGCMLDMRDLPVFLGIRELLTAGEIGDVHAMSFAGQHPLLYGSRASWYFEEGMHGGVLNDIAVHAVDFIPWATGLAIERIVGARCWNATVPAHPHFQQCGQAMLTLENGAGVIGDVSYLTPDSFAYDFPHYWRTTIWGADGVIEAGVNSRTLSLYRNGESQARQLELPPGRPGGYLDAFLRELGGERSLHLSSSEALAAARISLLLQEAADTLD